jgi:hypothetical protein
MPSRWIDRRHSFNFSGAPGDYRENPPGNRISPVADAGFGPTLPQDDFNL